VDDPKNKLAEIVFDETVSILDIPGFAKQLGRISPLYRSRKVSLTIIIQALWQLDDELARQVWNMANVVCFTLENVEDTEIIAKQLFKYDPQFVKHMPKTQYQNATTESEGGQDRMIADFIQDMEARSFIARIYVTEQKKRRVCSSWRRRMTCRRTRPTYQF
jgi:hypothetical protein